MFENKRANEEDCPEIKHLADGVGSNTHYNQGRG